MGHYCTVITVMYSTEPGMGPRKGLTEFITSMRNILQALRGIYSHDPTLKDPERDKRQLAFSSVPNFSSLSLNCRVVN